MAKRCAPVAASRAKLTIAWTVMKRQAYVHHERWGNNKRVPIISAKTLSHILAEKVSDTKDMSMWSMMPTHAVQCSTCNAAHLPCWPVMLAMFASMGTRSLAGNRV